jgi:hypothetical protein
MNLEGGMQVVDAGIPTTEFLTAEGNFDPDGDFDYVIGGVDAEYVSCRRTWKDKVQSNAYYVNNWHELTDGLYQIYYCATAQDGIGVYGTHGWD